MLILAAPVAAGLIAAFAAAVHRARREWGEGDELSRATAALITASWVLTAAAFVIALAWRPLPLGLPAAPAVAAGVGLAVAGIVLAAPGYLPFGSLRHLFGLDRGGLITEGVFRFSRNPQYTGIGLALTGGALAAGSGLGLAVALAYWAGIRAWLTVEEAHLEDAFGERYVRYRQSVSRFVGRPGRRGASES